MLARRCFAASALPSATLLAARRGLQSGPLGGEGRAKLTSAFERRPGAPTGRTLAARRFQGGLQPIFAPIRSDPFLAAFGVIVGIAVARGLPAVAGAQPIHLLTFALIVYLSFMVFGPYLGGLLLLILRLLPQVSELPRIVRGELGILRWAQMPPPPPRVQGVRIARCVCGCCECTGVTGVLHSPAPTMVGR